MDSVWSDEQERPLQHLRVIDLSIMLPGPYLTRLLAQYGADVIKVENLPKGDPVRDIENSAIFEFLNQGKRSIALNLKSEAGTAIVRQLAGEADVFVENFREGVMDKMGLGYFDLSEKNPDLIYLSLRGLSGKNSVHAGHDLNFIANSGCGEWFLESGVPNYSTQFGDIVGGTFVPALKLLFHLANPARRGMHLISHMDESFRSLYITRAFENQKSEAEGKPYGTHQLLNGSLPHSRYYRCQDGHWVTLNAVQKKHWDAFCDVADRPAWKERMVDPTLVSEMESLFRTAPSTHWEGLAAKKELCLFRVIPWSEHLTFSQAGSQLSTDPLSWCGFLSNPKLTEAPLLGEYTYTLLHSAGLANREIAELLQGGIAFQNEKRH